MWFQYDHRLILSPSCLPQYYSVWWNISTVLQLLQGPAGRIKEALQKVELSTSSYDTAWVAMVPGSNSVKNPQFPQCIDWILENQHPDGSWGPYCRPHLMKDTLSSTLACVIALKRWNLGEEHIETGIIIGKLAHLTCYPSLNRMWTSCLICRNQLYPISFVIYPWWEATFTNWV